MSEETQVSPQTQGSGQSAVALPPVSAVPEPSDSMALHPGFREREEINALLMGFGTGLSIAFIFLIYIVLEAAKLLP